jgi:hypothetical protein
MSLQILVRFEPIGMVLAVLPGTFVWLGRHDLHGLSSLSFSLMVEEKSSEQPGEHLCLTPRWIESMWSCKDEVLEKAWAVHSQARTSFFLIRDAALTHCLIVNTSLA